MRKAWLCHNLPHLMHRRSALAIISQQNLLMRKIGPCIRRDFWPGVIKPKSMVWDEVKVHEVTICCQRTSNRPCRICVENIVTRSRAISEAFWASERISRIIYGFVTSVNQFEYLPSDAIRKALADPPCCATYQSLKEHSDQRRGTKRPRDTEHIPRQDDKNMTDARRSSVLLPRGQYVQAQNIRTYRDAARRDVSPLFSKSTHMRRPHQCRYAKLIVFLRGSSQPHLGTSITSGGGRIIRAGQTGSLFNTLMMQQRSPQPLDTLWLQ